MTESIAVDTAGKLATGPKPAPSPSKAPENPDPATRTATDASKANPTPSAPSAGVTSRSSFFQKKKAAVIASAAFSLIAGIAGVRLMWPSGDDTKTAQAPNQEVPDNAKANPGSGTKPSPYIPNPGVPTNQSAPTGTTSPEMGIPIASIVGSGGSQTIASPVAPQVTPPAQVTVPPAQGAARYKITDESIKAFRTTTDFVPEAVISKLEAVKNNEYTEVGMRDVIDLAFLGQTKLSEYTKSLYKDHILKCAKMPQTVMATQPGSGQLSVLPVSTSVSPSPVKPVARYMITDEVLTKLKNAGVADSVLDKLRLFVKDRECLQADMEREISSALVGWTFDAKDTSAWKTYILEAAKIPDASASPSTKAQTPASTQTTSVSTPSSSGTIIPPNPNLLGVPTVTPPASVSSNSSTPPVVSMPQMPAVSPSIPTMTSTSPSVSPIPPPSLTTPTSQSTTPSGNTREPFGPAGSYNRKDHEYNPSGLPVMPPNPTTLNPPQVIVGAGGQEPSKVSSPPLVIPPVMPPMPVTSGQTSTPGGTQTSNPGSTIPVPSVDMTKLTSPPASTGTLPVPSVGPSPTTTIPSPTTPMPTVQQVPSAGTHTDTVSPKPSPTATGAPGDVGMTAGNLKSNPSPSSAPTFEKTPTTSYDVDLYEPKQGDTYETISRDFYNDTRYAAALKAANQNKPLTSGGTIDVPPLHILKQKYPTSARTVGMSSQSAPLPPAAPTAPSAPAASSSPWGPPSTSSTPVGTSSATRTYVVPVGGTSMVEMAKTYLGNQSRWMEIYNLNPSLSPSVIPAGTQVQLPADAKLPNSFGAP